MAVDAAGFNLFPVEQKHGVFYSQTAHGDTLKDYLTSCGQIHRIKLRLFVVPEHGIFERYHEFAAAAAAFVYGAPVRRKQAAGYVRFAGKLEGYGYFRLCKVRAYRWFYEDIAHMDNVP